MAVIVQLRDRHQFEAGNGMEQTPHVLHDPIYAVVFVQGNAFMYWLGEVPLLPANAPPDRR